MAKGLHVLVQLVPHRRCCAAMGVCGSRLACVHRLPRQSSQHAAETCGPFHVAAGDAQVASLPLLPVLVHSHGRDESEIQFQHRMRQYWANLGCPRVPFPWVHYIPEHDDAGHSDSEVPLQSEAGRADPDQGRRHDRGLDSDTDSNLSGMRSSTPSSVAPVEIPPGYTSILTPGGSVWGYVPESWMAPAFLRGWDQIEAHMSDEMRWEDVPGAQASSSGTLPASYVEVMIPNNMANAAPKAVAKTRPWPKAKPKCKSKSQAKSKAAPRVNKRGTLKRPAASSRGL